MVKCIRCGKPAQFMTNLCPVCRSAYDREFAAKEQEARETATSARAAATSLSSGELGALTQRIESIAETAGLDPTSEKTKQDLADALRAFKDVFPDVASAFWEAETRQGRKGFMVIADFASAIANGDIRRETPTRRISYDDVALPFPSFANLGDGLAKSVFGIRILFEPPIWSHSTFGAAAGARAGAIIYPLVSAGNVWQFNPIIGMGFLAGAIWQGLSALPAQAKAAASKVLAFAPFLIAYIAIRIVSQSLSTYTGQSILMSVAIGAGAFGTAPAIGALLLVLPGMFVGTLVGLVKSRGLRRSPEATPERNRVLVTGLVLPFVGSALVFWAFIQLVKWYAAWIERNPLFR